MSDNVSRTDDVRRAWGRVTSWLEQNAPVTYEAISGPASEKGITDAEERIGVSLPQDLREWLLMNSMGQGSPDPVGCLVSWGCGGIVSQDAFLLGIRDIERVYLHQMGTEVMEPSDDPDYPNWRQEWIPFMSEGDGFYGQFVDARDGRVGRWSEGSLPEVGQYPSLAAYFDRVAEGLERIAAEGIAACRIVDGRLVWS